MLFISITAALTNLLLMVRAYHANNGVAVIVHLFLLVVFVAVALLLQERRVERARAIARHPSTRAQRAR
jgi:hypothetical protein